MEGGQIAISIKEESEKLIFEVGNNGDIMECDTVERMNRLLHSGDAKWQNNSSKAGGGYGVGNVARRLKLKYEDSVEMKYIVERERTICRIEFAVEKLSKENIV